MTYTVGSIVTVSGEFKDASGAPVDPSTGPVLTIQDPAGVTTSPSPTHDSIGQWHYNLTVTLPGLYFYSWNASGNGVAKTIQEGFITVAASIFRAASTIDLCTLDAVKMALGMKPDNNDQDLNLSSLITSLSQLFYNLVQREGLNGPVSYVERRNGRGTRQIVTLHAPIISVTAVSINSLTIPQSTDGVKPGWAYDKFSIYLIEGLNGTGFQFWKGSQNVELRYSAGFLSVPADIADAVKMAVAYRYKRMPKLGLNSEALASIGQTNYTKEDLPPEFMTTVKQYKDRAVITE